MTHSDYFAAELAVVETSKNMGGLFREHSSPWTLDNLVAEFATTNPPRDRLTVVQAVWELMADGVIEFDRDYNLVATTNRGHATDA